MYIRIDDPQNAFIGGTIELVYDASGAKLQKIIKDKNSGVPPVVYDYINGVEYKDNVLQRIPHTEGAVSRQTDGSFLHEYVLRDHLGNARVTFTDANNDGVVGESDITQINHYYSFGLNMEGNWNGSFPDVKNKYGYNEKELNTDFGLNWNDYGARFYDAAVARFQVVDRFSEKYSNINPYQYAKNNPIKYIDINGDSAIIGIYLNGGNGKETASLLYTDKAGGKPFSDGNIFLLLMKDKNSKIPQVKSVAEMTAFAKKNKATFVQASSANYEQYNENGKSTWKLNRIETEVFLRAMMNTAGLEADKYNLVPKKGEAIFTLPVSMNENRIVSEFGGDNTFYYSTEQMSFWSNYYSLSNSLDHENFRSSGVFTKFSTKAKLKKRRCWCRCFHRHLLSKGSLTLQH